MQQLENDIKAAEGYKTVADLDLPWVPIIYLSSSYSYSGDFKAQSRDNGVSSTLMFTFNLFDGFLAKARRQQANILVQTTKNKKIIETNLLA